MARIRGLARATRGCRGRGTAFGMVLLSMMAIASGGCIPVDTPTGGSSSSSSSGSRSSTGSLFISDDNGKIFVNGVFRGQGSASLSNLPPGTYAVQVFSPVDGRECWATNARVLAGKSSTVKNNQFCR